MRVGESNRIFRFFSGFDMTAFTELTLTLLRPDGTSFTRNTTSTSPVTLGNGVLDPDLGVLPAKQYIEYKIVAGDIDQVGRWKARLTYARSSDTPPSVLISDDAEFFVT